MKSINVKILMSLFFLMNTFTSVDHKNIGEEMCNLWTNSKDKTNVLSIDVIEGKKFLTYIGSELNSKNERIYFLSRTSEFSIEKGVLKFSLKTFYFSKSKIDIDNQKFEELAKEEVPYILSYDLRFLGTIKDSKLYLDRVSDLYDSKSDKSIFTCK